MYFVYICVWSFGVLFVCKDDGGLEFFIGMWDFYVCIYEIKVGLEMGMLKILKVYYLIYFECFINFVEFIDIYYKLCFVVSVEGDEVCKFFYKFVMNFSYGKFV